MPKKTAATLPSSLEHFDTLPDSASVRQPTVEALFGVSPATVWRWVNTGRLPQPRRIGRVTAWSAGSLREVLNGKAA